MSDLDENKGGAGDLIEQLLKNPELISKAASLLSGLKLSGEGAGSADASTEVSEGSPPASDNFGGGASDENPGNQADMSDVSSKISSLLANKELMSMLPDILSAFKPQNKSPKPEGGDLAAGVLISGGHHHHKHGIDKRNALILALKPYLNGRRREAIDYLIRLEKLGNIFKTIN